MAAAVFSVSLPGEETEGGDLVTIPKVPQKAGEPELNPPLLVLRPDHFLDASCFSRGKNSSSPDNCT